MFDGKGMSPAEVDAGDGHGQDVTGGTGRVGSAVVDSAGRHRVSPRWLYPLVVVLSVLTVCSGPVLAVGAWLVRETAVVSQAGRSPSDAAYGVLSSLDRWQPAGLAGTERYVMPQRWEEVAVRLVQMRRQLGASGEDYSAQMSNARTVRDGSLATVTVDVAMMYTVQNEGHIVFQTTQALPWTFRAVYVFGLVNGWKVDGFDNPEPFARPIASEWGHRPFCTGSPGHGTAR